MVLIQYVLNRCISFLYYVTNYHTLSGLKQHIFIISQSLWVCLGILCWLLYKDAINISAWGLVLIWRPNW